MGALWIGAAYLYGEGRPKDLDKANYYLTLVGNQKKVAHFDKAVSFIIYNKVVGDYYWEINKKDLAKQVYQLAKDEEAKLQNKETLKRYVNLYPNVMRFSK